MSFRHRAMAFGLAFSLGIGPIGCSSSKGSSTALDDGSAPATSSSDAAASQDQDALPDAGSPPDAGPRDGGGGGSPPMEGGSLSSTDASGSSDLDDISRWATFDVAAGDSGANGFVGATFDGRYLYFPPSYGNSLLARFDTQSSFTSAASWSFFDLSSLNPNLQGSLGCVFDGRYVYVMGGNALATNDDDTIVRFDTQGTFGDKDAWTTLDLTTVHNVQYSFGGAVFDGRYVYFLAYDDRQMARYDTQGAFDSAASWTFFAGAGGGFMGGVFDGRYVDMVPWTSNLPGTPATRYDTKELSPTRTRELGRPSRSPAKTPIPWASTAGHSTGDTSIWRLRAIKSQTTGLSRASTHRVIFRMPARGPSSTPPK